MPDSLNIAAPPRPTAQKHFYAPAFPDGLTDDGPTAGQVLPTLSAYPAVEARGGNEPMAYSQSPARTSTVLILLIVSFLLTAYCYRKGFNYFSRLLRDLWSVKRTENHLDEHNANDLLLMTALIAITVIMEGIIVYSAIRTNFPDYDIGDISRGMAVSIGLAGGYYLLQMALVWLTGYIFSEKAETRIWVQGYNASQIVMGLALTPVALVILFVPEYDLPMISAAILLYMTAKAIFLIKGFRIFYTNIFRCFYFILYLCALEIAPLILFYKSILQVYES